jgi:hypothetical protein
MGDADFNLNYSIGEEPEVQRKDAICPAPHARMGYHHPGMELGSLAS